jgi:hypothetical protein
MVSRHPKVVELWWKALIPVSDGDQSASEYWWSERRVEMSERVIKSLRELMDNIEQNSASVESKLAINGSKPDSAIVMSAAKYHKALEMLAKE